ncbi:TIGR03087 family PEP-CTERM/XrtA system glycosyltransferase [Roseateles asaccharophilus]|uniref:Sugar transferase (PEP-CTERM/EpsH1 system associated) n=1 Tax=Roseateles asaccharophilus TaxID=582607 RepID=A0ABU2AC67_9BURK|nr:TIGR03087 family PEP-CTERM/XrtA system glycosyltransferase [Roseateles asaccharophilus]MDR7334183.1 sugar transferase (PEP-CTERM/EpsH1 system associated) [Roseateles asaccharophilus]
MKILYLVHRLPYPPNKGDKVRSYHLLKHLAARHEVHLGTFVDDPDDEQHLPRVRELCTDLHVARLNPRTAKLLSLRGLLTGEALSLPYYRDASLQAWVDEGAARGGFDAVVVFSGVMAQYVPPALRKLVDFVDVDSAKWRDYAPEHAWPMSWLYRREFSKLLAFEQAVAAGAQCSFFVTDNEVALFRELSPGRDLRLAALGNGVDAEFFAPDPVRASPFAAGELPLVFTGAMDYWPNVDAVTWFVHDMLPALRERFPALRFHIVGRSPAPAVQALAGDFVNVTGTVPDVRPYLQHAAAVVAPLRLARGIQNKVLEAMAMARPVVAAGTCVRAIATDTQPGLIAADDASGYVDRITALLADAAAANAAGRAAREFVLGAYSWDAHLAGLDRHLEAA